MPIYQNQSSFAGGELSPDAQARVDIAKYKTGAKTLRNFLVGTKGSAFNRQGTRFVGAAKYNDRASRVIPFIFSNDAAYILEFGDEYIRFYKDGGEILEDTADSVIPFWDTTQTYSINEYVLFTKTDFTIHLYKSLKYANIAKNPETETTYWSDIHLVTQWSAATTYASGDYVYEINLAGKRKLFISQQNSNLNHDPLPSNYWTENKPAAYSSSTTYQIGSYASYTDGFGNVSIYRSMRPSNTGHDIFTEGAWWQFWNGPLTWDVGTTYVTGDYVIIDDSGVFKSFQSNQDSNVGHSPLSFGTTYWVAFDSPSFYEIETPYSHLDLATLKYIQSADTLYLTHKNYAPMLLQRIGDNDWTLSDYAYENGPFRLPNTDINKSLRVYADGPDYHMVTSGIPSYDYFTPEMVGALFQLNYQIPSSSVTEDFSGTGSTSNITIGGLGNWRLVIGGSISGTYVLEKSTDGGSTWVEMATYRNIAVNTFGTESNDGDPFLMRVRCTAFTDIGDGNGQVTLSADSYNQTGIVRIETYTDARNVFVSLIKNVLLAGVEAFTFDWAEGAWSDYRGWPATVAFAQDRLVFGGNDSEPQTEWMTKSGNYVDFGRSSPLVDSDGITVNLLSRQINPIRSLISILNSLIGFTASSEFTTEGISDGPLTPTNVFTKLQGLRGINDVDPIIVGNNIIFVSPLSSSVRAMSFDLVKGSFETPSISTIADHLIRDNQIVAMAYQQEPDSTAWLVRDDGVLIAFTYLKEEEILAWTKHDTQDGLFESVAVIPGTDTEEVWFVVKRGTLRFIERMLKRTTSTDPADQYFVDCGLVYNGSAVTSLTGLDHLNGQSVTINAAGFILPDQTVSNGTITLDQARSKVIVGLPITPDLELLNPDYPLKDGTSQGRKYHLASCNIRFLNSRGGVIGMDSTVLDQEIDVRDESLAAATPTPLFSGYLENQVAIPQNDDSRGHLMFRQNEPMPVTILAITTVVEPGDSI